jgi:hypothetical protein
LPLKGDKVFNETTQNCLKQNGLNKSKKNLSVMLSLPKTYNFGNRLGDNRMKAILNVIYNSFAMYFMISSKELNDFQ